jgi:kynurenine formamidase
VAAKTIEESRLKRHLMLAAAAAGLALPAVAVEPPDLLALAKTSPQPPWPAGDERGMANTLGAATTQRCAWHMAQPQAKWFEASQVRSNTMPKTPFGGPGGLKPKPTAAVPFSRHVFNSEVFEADAEPGQQGTQIDALGHFGSTPDIWDPKGPLAADQATYYGGLTQKDVKPSPDSPLLKLGLEKIPPLVTTAVLLDARRQVGKGAPMTDGQVVTQADIEAMLSAQGLAARGILPGDMVWIYTGWSEHWRDPAGDTPYYSMAPGLSVDAAGYLGARRVVAVGLDTPFIDPAADGMLQGKAPPAAGTPPGLPFAIHHQLLTQFGIHHLENLKLAELVKDRVWTSCAMVLPTLEKGSAGAAVRPVAVGVPGQ